MTLFACFGRMFDLLPSCGLILRAMVAVSPRHRLRNTRAPFRRANESPNTRSTYHLLTAPWIWRRWQHVRIT